MSRIANLPHFVIGFVEGPKPVSGVWRCLAEYLGARKTLPRTVELSQMVGHSEEYCGGSPTIQVSVTEVEQLLIERKLKGFIVYGHSGARSVQYFLTHCEERDGGYILGCYLEKDAKVPTSWAAFIEQIAKEYPILGAWQYMSLYQFWQCDRAGDRFYKMRWGEIPAGYRTVRQTIPGPGRQEEKVTLDISLNPGRSKELPPGVSFYPTSEMWLGPQFWSFAMCTKDEVLGADFFLEKHDFPEYLYLKCWPEPFSRPDGEQGRVQQRLWKLLFRENCEWPPGSGGIAERPVYGPPELGIRPTKHTVD